MDRPRIGELLARYVDLTDDHVSAILEDQTSSRRRFGDIALALGLCKPHHIWRAWWTQLSGAPYRVDLDALGMDTEAIDHLPGALAVQYQVVPIRVSGSQLVLAAAEGSLMRAMEELPRQVKMQVKFVLADPQEVRRAIATAYPHLFDKRPIAIPA